MIYRALAKNVKGFWKDGSWFRDEHEKYHHISRSEFWSRSKLPPYLPISPLEVKELSKLDLDSESFGRASTGDSQD